MNTMVLNQHHYNAYRSLPCFVIYSNNIHFFNPWMCQHVTILDAIYKTVLSLFVQKWVTRQMQGDPFDALFNGWSGVLL